MSSSPVVRFAPSPTGRIHIGNARTALLNWLFALKRGGRFILRYDDTDLERSRTEYADAIAVDLNWLGVTPHLVRRQSERVALYDDAARKLREMGRLYPCYETAEELDRRRKRQQALGRPPIYDRAALRLTNEDRAALEAQGRQPHSRFKLDSTMVRWDDLVRGESHIDCASLSDPVLRREDGSYLYTLPSVVDDVDLEVTHVIRGEDHVTNTAVQIQIFEALAGRAPMFGHHNLLTDSSGEGLSKRTGALSIASLRESGAGGSGRFGGIGSPDRVAGGTRRDLRPRQVEPSPRAVRRGGIASAFRAHAPCHAFRRRARPVGGARRRGSFGGSVLDRGARQSDPLRRRADLVERGPRRDRPDRRGPGVSCPGGRRPAGGAVERGDLGRMDRRAQTRNRTQGARIVPSAAPRADRARVGPRTRGAVAADRPR
jgi:hypothetical protein